jgi:hypothetical protein
MKTILTVAVVAVLCALLSPLLFGAAFKPSIQASKGQAWPSNIKETIAG